METVSDFILGGSKINADGDCSHEIKRCLLLRRKVMTNLDSILKSRNISLPTKVHIVKVFPVVMWELDWEERWALKTWCFWIIVLEKTLESALDWKEIQPVHPKIIPEYSLEGLMLKLKLHYFVHLMRWSDSFERPWCWDRLRAGEEGDNRRWDGWITSLTQWT